jgi:chemotaxis methyl-accepting protein methylase
MGVNNLVRKLGLAGERIWRRLPADAQQRPALRGAGKVIHKLSARFSDRRQSTGTWFLRNQALLLTIQELTEKLNLGASVRICSIGCSTGAEIYSGLWAVRKARPDLKIFPVGIDGSEPVIEMASSGRYLRQAFELGQMNDQLLSEFFDEDGDCLKVKRWIAEGIQWLVADARDPNLLDRIGQQDVLLANNFLIHMKQADASACSAKLLKLTKPGGLLVCRGIDLDVREKLVTQHHLKPIATRIEEIHNAEPERDARRDWPWRYWSLEPMDKTRRRWLERYAAIFRVPESNPGMSQVGQRI